MKQQPHEFEDMTEAQKTFWQGMTTQRVANLWEAADDWAALSPEAKVFLRGASKEKIKQLDSTISFMNAAGIIGKFLWIGGATAFGLFVGITQLWELINKFLKVTPR